MASPSIKFSYSIPDKTNPRPSRQPVDSAGKRCGARTRACRIGTSADAWFRHPRRLSAPSPPSTKRTQSLFPLRDFLRVPASPRQIRPSLSTKRTQPLFLSALFSASPRLRVQPGPPPHKTNPIVIPLRDFLRVPASPRQIRPSPSTKRTQSLFFSASPRLRVQSAGPQRKLTFQKP